MDNQVVARTHPEFNEYVKVCVCRGAEDPTRMDQGRADARLIAAAPELLQALQTFIDALENNRGMMDCEAIARAAIAKATGM